VVECVFHSLTCELWHLGFRARWPLSIRRPQPVAEVYMPRLMLAKSADYLDLAPADQLYRSGLERRGAEVETGVWADDRAGFRDADLVAIRSTWDYHRDLDAYRACLDSHEQADAAVANPVPAGPVESRKDLSRRARRRWNSRSGRTRPVL